MNLFNSASLEEIPLDDVDRSSMEYRVFLAYAQRRLSRSKYGQLLESEQKNQKGSSGKEEMQRTGPAGKGSSSPGSLPREVAKKRKKKKKKKFKWKQKLVPSCLRGQTEEGLWRREAPNGHARVGVGSTRTEASATQDDEVVALVADRLADIVSSTQICCQSGHFKASEHPDGLEIDGGSSSKQVSEGGCGNDKEEHIIGTIVTLLRKSGDELNEKMKKDQIFSRSFGELMSYVFFWKVADHFVEESLLGSATDPEVDVQSTRVAFAMEVIARLTAVDGHPMNTVLGFGMKYLKENFNPWIQSQGGWEKAFGLPDSEEVE